MRLGFPRLALETVRRCTCSYCRRRGAIAISVPVEDLEVLAGDTLTLYQFGTHSAEHYFCARCGIYTHHRRRSNPGEYGVNLGCVDGLDADTLTALAVPWADGVNHPADR